LTLDKKSQELYDQLGLRAVKVAVLQLKPASTPILPDGKDDNTHFNELGARMIAQIVLQEIRAVEAELAERIIKAGRQIVVLVVLNYRKQLFFMIQSNDSHICFAFYCKKFDASNHQSAAI
jgi:hypothetical protein